MNIIFLSGALATVTQDQAMNSIRQNLGSRIDTPLLIWVGVLVVIVVAALIYFSKRAAKKESGVKLNHPGKLVKEISQAVGLKPAEMKKLRELSDKLELPGNVRVKNPMILLICPSLLAKAMKKK